MIKIEKIWLTDDAIHIKSLDGKTACELFADYPLLRAATEEERKNFTADEFGIHWPELDEDLSYEGFFMKEERPPYLYTVFMSHPELNASAVARRLGMSQSLLAQYISGVKIPSSDRMNLILDEIRTIGRELSGI